MTAVTRILRPGKSQDVAIGATSVKSAAFQAGTKWVRMVATSACYVAIGTNPTAAAGSAMRLAPNFPEVFQINANELVAVIQDAASGKLTLTEVSG